MKTLLVFLAVIVTFALLAIATEGWMRKDAQLEAALDSMRASALRAEGAKRLLVGATHDLNRERQAHMRERRRLEGQADSLRTLTATRDARIAGLLARLDSLPKVEPSDDPRLHLQAEVIREQVLVMDEQGQTIQTLSDALTQADSVVAAERRYGRAAQARIYELEQALAATRRALEIATAPEPWLPKIGGDAAKVGLGVLLGAGLSSLRD